MTKAELESKHLSELHAMAAEAGVDKFRMLRREDLVDRLLDGGDGSGGGDRGRDRERDGDSGERGRRRGGSSRARERTPRRRGSRDGDEDGDEGRKRRRRGGREGGDDRGKSAGRKGGAGREKGGGSRADEDPKVDGAIAGPLEITGEGHGLVREDDQIAYVSAAQIKRCELRVGDLVAGPTRPARRGERHRTLVRVESVNGAEPETGRPPEFERLTPVTPTRRIELAPEADDVLTRSADLLAPLAFGQRVLVRAEPRSGRTTLLRGIAKSILAGAGKASVAVLLIDERPEEVTEWSRQVPDADLHAAPADTLPAEQAAAAELVLAQAKRRAERGEDVVLIIDSLTRLAVALGDPAAVKPYFGAGRDLAEQLAGSLTVIGVSLGGSEEGADVARMIATTESTSLDMSANLAAEGLVPSLLAVRPSVAGEELLREREELEAARRLRAELRLMPAEEASRTLAQRITATASNAELLRG